MSDQITTSDEQAILEIERETFEAIRNKDAEALDRLLDEGFVYRSPGGPESCKADFIKVASQLPVRILSVWGEELKVNIYGEAAVLTGVQHAKVLTDDGKEVISSVAFTDIFVKRLNGWAMTLAYGVELGISNQSKPLEK